MGYGSQKGQVGFKTQPVQGTYKDPGAVSPNEGTFMRLRGGAFGANRQLLIPDAEIGGNRDESDAYLGSVGYVAPYEFYVRLESLPTLVYGALGAKSSTDNAGAGSLLVGTHVLTGGATLPWISVEEAVSDFDVFNYTDSKVDKLHLDAAGDAYLAGTAELVAISQTAGNTKTAVPNWDLKPMIVSTNIVTKWNTVAVPSKSFTFDIANNIETNDFRLGSLVVGDLVEKRRQVTAGLVIRPSDTSFWRSAVFGSPSATAPIAGVSLKGALQIICQTYQVIGTSVIPYSLQIDIPSCSIKPYALTVKGDDVMQDTLAFEALRPDPTVSICTVTIKNGKAAVY